MSWHHAGLQALPDRSPKTVVTGHYLVLHSAPGCVPLQEHPGELLDQSSDFVQRLSLWWTKNRSRLDHRNLTVIQRARPESESPQMKGRGDSRPRVVVCCTKDVLDEIRQVFRDEIAVVWPVVVGRGLLSHTMP
ncbi:MAG: hypothetical protein M3O22_04940 [Pseudomonadota bacterium]|nr:hypothetical protein [Pseudomonadota bacterium]